MHVYEALLGRVLIAELAYALATMVCGAAPGRSSRKAAGRAAAVADCHDMLVDDVACVFCLFVVEALTTSTYRQTARTVRPKGRAIETASVP